MSTAEPTGGSETVLNDLDLTRSVTVQWIVVGLLGLVVSFGVFTGLYQATTGRVASFSFGPAGVEWWNEALDLLVIGVLVVAIILPHEWLHGLAIRYYGGTPRYGVASFVLPYATTDHRFTRNQFVVVALTPLVVFTIVGIPLLLAAEWAWLIVPLAANTSGAVGDLWMALTVLRYPAHVHVEDQGTGMRILGRQDDQPRSLSVSGLVWDALVGAAVGSIGTWALLGFVTPMVLLSLNVGSLTVGTPGTITFLFEFRNTATEISYTIGSGWVVSGGVIGLIYAFVRTHWRQRAPPTTRDEG